MTFLKYAAMKQERSGRMDQVLTGKFIADERKKKGYTQTELADRLGIREKRKTAVAGMALSLPRLASAIGMEESLAYRGSDYISLLLGVVTAAFVLAVVLLIVSTMSKDVKQATTIAPVFLFIMIIPMLLGSTESFSASIEEIGIINYLIPVWNSAKLLKDVIELSYSVPSLVLTCILNLIVAVAGIFVIGRLFEQERIINQ
jgi:ABC-type Na+ efflux pump permease subunit